MHRRLLGIKFNLGSHSEKRVVLDKQMFPFYAKEDLIDRILIHCDKTRVSWNFMFLLFGISWVLTSSVRDAFKLALVRGLKN